MSNFEIDKLNIKVKCNVSNLERILEKNDFKRTSSYFVLDIYFVTSTFDYSSITSIGTIDDYAILEEINGNEAKIIFREKGEFRGVISGINSTKKLLEKFGYKELMYINKDINVYSNNDFSIQINDVKNQGIFLTFTANDITEVDDILKCLKDLHISYENKDIYLDNENIELNKIKNRYI